MGVCHDRIVASAIAPAGPVVAVASDAQGAVALLLVAVLADAGGNALFLAIALFLRFMPA